jgi:hypothetical protein
VPDRRRIGHVNVVCIKIDTVLAGKRAMGKRTIREGGLKWGSWLAARVWQGWGLAAMYKEPPFQVRYIFQSPVTHSCML